MWPGRRIGRRSPVRLAIPVQLVFNWTGLALRILTTQLSTIRGFLTQHGLYKVLPH